LLHRSVGNTVQSIKDRLSIMISRRISTNKEHMEIKISVRGDIFSFTKSGF